MSDVDPVAGVSASFTLPPCPYVGSYRLPHFSFFGGLLRFFVSWGLQLIDLSTYPGGPTTYNLSLITGPSSVFSDSKQDCKSNKWRTLRKNGGGMTDQVKGDRDAETRTAEARYKAFVRPTDPLMLAKQTAGRRFPFPFPHTRGQVRAWKRPMSSSYMTQVLGTIRIETWS